MGGTLTFFLSDANIHECKTMHTGFCIDIHADIFLFQKKKKGKRKK